MIRNHHNDNFVTSSDNLYHSHTESYNNEDLTPVQKFYENSHILITGATGFLGIFTNPPSRIKKKNLNVKFPGKILVEKLLRSCPTISTLYLVVRNKKNDNLEERLDKLFEDVLFDRLKKECPKYRHKIVGISGDGLLPGLGLSIEDRKRLIEEVNTHIPSNRQSSIILRGRLT